MTGAAIFEAGTDEGSEEGVRGERLGFEFGVKLAADEPGVIGHFNDFDVDAVGRATGDAEAGARQSGFVFTIEFVAVAVALGDFEGAVGFGCEGAGLEFAGPRAQAHRAAHFVHAEKLAQFVNDAIRGGWIEFRAVRILDF